MKAALQGPELHTWHLRSSPSSERFGCVCLEPYQNSNIDLSKRQMNDPMITFVYEQDTNRVFYEFEHLLSGIFICKSIKLADTYLQMHKNEFIQILAEIGMLIQPKKKTPEEEKKEKEAREKQAAG